MKKNIIQFTIAGVFLLIFGFILYNVITKKVDTLDQSIYEKIAKFITPTNTKIVKCITFCGSVFGIAIGILVSYFFLKKNFDKGFITIALLGEAALNNLIKVIIKRPRPTIYPLVKETGYSFPSGHTMSSTAFFALILFFLWKSHLPSKIKIILSIPCILIIIFVLASRIYLGVHYFSDVIAGLCLSISYVLIIITFYDKIKSYFI